MNSKNFIEKFDQDTSLGVFKKFDENLFKKTTELTES